MQSVGAPAVPAMFSTYDGAGNGVRVADVARLRDSFLETRGHQEHGTDARLTETNKLYAGLEDLFGEPTDTGIQSQLSQLWNAWHDVSNQPGDLAARSQLLQRAGTLTDSVHSTYDTLAAKWGDTRDQLGAVASEVTTTAATVAQLNQAILRNSQAGLPANDLSDQRDALVMKLADLVGATGSKGENGVVDVYIGGTALVRGTTSEALEVKGTTDFGSATTDPVQLSWVGGGYVAAVSGGTAAGQLDALGRVLPAYADHLDGFAASLASAVNAVHADGYALDGSQPGAFFTGTTAATLAVAVTTPSGVAASAYPGGSLDGSVADRLGKLASAPNGPDAVYRNVIVNLGVEAQSASRQAAIQKQVTGAVDAARESEAGVDVDEEMVNMVMYQRAYEAASRMINAVDAALDTLINRTGLVGR
jgi:flagellar hook-associated protein 1 FlgK